MMMPTGSARPFASKSNAHEHVREGSKKLHTVDIFSSSEADWVPLCF
jgi:hypothetical protein